jgi:hypothetical protein
MAEHDEPLNGAASVPWRDRSPEEHGRALANLMLYVSAAPRRPKDDTLTFPVLKRLLPRPH